jgi:hypothetical protein
MSANFDQIVNDHEIRLRVLERIAEGIDHRLDKLESKMDSQFKFLHTTMTTQFYWMLGIMITLFGGIILHMAKLI